MSGGQNEKQAVNKFQAQFSESDSQSSPPFR